MERNEKAEQLARTGSNNGGSVLKLIELRARQVLFPCTRREVGLVFLRMDRRSMRRVAGFSTGYCLSEVISRTASFLTHKKPNRKTEDPRNGTFSFREVVCGEDMKIRKQQCFCYLT